MARKRRRYTDKFRASAVVMLEAAGYPDSKGALQQTADHLGVPPTTLHGWYNATHNPPPTEVRDEKKTELADLINAELEAIFGEMPNARQDASFRDLGTVAGILIDKRQLIAGRPTGILQIDDVSDSDIIREFSQLLDTARERAGREADADN